MQTYSHIFTHTKLGELWLTANMTIAEFFSHGLRAQLSAEIVQLPFHQLQRCRCHGTSSRCQGATNKKKTV